ncbi:hypothetical protein B0H16DRAFT_650963 [Mycena metata]|uniref:Ubiquitin-like domain-containing protein n=1 Tax=Mycena metata TaxID=1033252 RepID=A0AAD7J6T8_9AGAR|nr:hypothetical protein B0H16DRAFT_650963 [Mycena metata]
MHEQRSKLSQVSQGEDDRAIPAAPSAIINNYYISGGSGGSGGRGGETGGSGGTGEGPRFIYKTYIGYQSRPEGILPRRSELPDDRWVASIVEKIISDRETSATQLRPLDNTLLIRLDYARLIPSRANLNFLRRLICSLSVLSADEQAMIRGDMAALLPVLTTTAVTDIERTTFALSGLAAAINPTTAIGLYTQTLILYIAAYIIWRLVVQITRSIPSAPGIDTKHTIVVIDILGLEFRLPLERCVTFEDFHSLMVERASERRNKSAAKYVLSRAYEVTDGSNSAVIYPHIWARKIRAGIKLEMAVLLHRRSVTCPWCGQENTQALWIHWYVPINSITPS